MPRLSSAPIPRPRHQSYLLACLLLAGFPLAPSALARSFIGGDNSLFADPNLWSPTGTPGTAANDVLTVGDFSVPLLSGDLHVTVNGLFGISNTISSLTFNSSALPAALIVTDTGGTIIATTEYIGPSSVGNTFNQGSGSANQVATLNMAGAGTSDNFYNLTSTGTSLTVSSTFNLGLDGIGVFTQSDGTVTVHNGTASAFLQIGVNSSGNGTYNLNGGALTVDFLRIGGTGTAVFNQTAGSITVNGNAIVSNGANSAPATYNYSGGTGTFTGGLSVGIKGTFNLKTGGALPFAVTVNANGTFNLAGGSFTTGGSVILNGGTFQTMGHSTSTTISGSGTIQNGSATASAFTPNTTTTPSFSGTITDGPSAPLGLTIATGTFTLSGTNNNYSGTTTVQTGATFKAGNSNVLSANSPVNLTGGTLDAQTFQNVIFSLAGTSTSTVNIGSSGDLIVASNGANTTYSGKFTGSGELAVNGSNTLTLSGSGATSTFTGFFLVQGGTLANGVADGMPTNIDIDINLASAALSIPFNQHIATFQTDQFNSITLANSASLLVGSSNANSSIGGNFSGTGALVKNGNGNLTIGFGSSDTNANTGSTVSITVNAGTFTLNKAAGTTAVAGNLLISGGTVALSASNQIADTSIVEIDSGLLKLNGFSETIGSLLGSGGTISIGSGSLNVAETATNSCGGSLSGFGTFTKSLSGTTTLSNASGFNGDVIVSGGTLIFSGGADPNSYSVITGGTLKFLNSSSSQIGSIPLSVGAATGAPSAVIIASTASFASNNSGITVNATGTLTVQAGGTLHVNGPLTNAGTLTSSGTLTGGSVVNPGNMTLGGTASFGTVDGVTSGTTSAQLSALGTTTISNNGIVSALRMRQQSIALHGNAGNSAAALTITESAPTHIAAPLDPAGDNQFVSVVKSLAIDNSAGTYFGKLDLTNNDLIIDYTGGTSPLASIEAMVKSGYNNGTWTGKGITSSVVATNPNLFHLAVLDNALAGGVAINSFDGIDTSNHQQVIVKFTWIADINLDGVVTSDDAIAFATFYSAGQTGAHHQFDDLNYDGTVDSNDAILFATVYNEALPHLPEPGTLSVLAVGAATLLRRKRARKIVRN